MTATREGAVARAEGHVDSGRFRDELAELVAHETESQEPSQAPALARYLEEAMRPRLERLGLACEVLSNPRPGGGAGPDGRAGSRGAGPRVLSYGHGDVIRAQDRRLARGVASVPPGRGGRSPTTAAARRTTRAST